MTNPDIQTFYYAGKAVRYRDGSLSMPVSSYEAQTHSSGVAFIKPDHADYDLWLWLIPRFRSLNIPFVGPEELNASRQQFHAEVETFGYEQSRRKTLFIAIPAYRKPSLFQRLCDVLEAIYFR